MKKMFQILALAFILSVTLYSEVSLYEAKAPSHSPGNWEVKEVDGGLIIERYLGNVNELKIPSTISGKKVVLGGYGKK